MKTHNRSLFGKQVLTLALCSLVLPIAAQTPDEEAAELAKKLSNPVASLVSVPIQYNYDTYGGVNDDASVSRLTMLPVVPLSINEDWNLITRTIFGVADNKDFAIAGLNKSGLTDTNVSLYFSPQAPTSKGMIWGAGPILLLPTATEDALGTDKWGVGPTAVALKQKGGWTFGILAGHIWSVAGNSERNDVSVTTLQPFLSFTTKTHTTFGAYTESSYDWKGEQWQVPLFIQAAQILKVGSQILQVGVGAKYWAEAADNGPKGWGMRVQVTLLYPKK